MNAVQTTRVLITVLTYPHPSTRWDELVCTGGVSEEGEWIRLYPIDYRYRPREQQFRSTSGLRWSSIHTVTRMTTGRRAAGRSGRRSRFWENRYRLGTGHRDGRSLTNCRSILSRN